jgi:hypothetical protein
MAISAAGMKVVATVYQVDFDIEDGTTMNRVINQFAERPLADMIPGKFSIWFWIRTDGTKRSPHKSRGLRILKYAAT